MFFNNKCIHNRNDFFYNENKVSRYAGGKRLKRVLCMLFVAFAMIFQFGCKTEEEMGGKEEEEEKKPEIFAPLTENGQLEAPKYETIDKFIYAKNPAIQSIVYDSVNYHGQQTRVFAYLGFPAGASAAAPVPAVVLVHGGAGTAFAEWVELWNRAGYAAIAMDTEGRYPDQTTQGLGGPSNDQLYTAKYSIEEQWMYHAVSAVMKAESLLLADPRVNAKQTGICGISWGSIVTAAALGVDERFAFGIPIYGSGFQSESLGDFRRNMKEHATKLWGAENLFPWYRAKVLWLNSDHDAFFSLNTTLKSAKYLKGSHATILPDLTHGHIEGWTPKDSVYFADSVIAGKEMLADFLQQPTNVGEKTELQISTGDAEFEKIELYALTSPYEYVYDGALPQIKQDFVRREVDFNVDRKTGKISFCLPEDVTVYYLNVTTKDNSGRKYVSTSELIQA